MDHLRWLGPGTHDLYAWPYRQRRGAPGAIRRRAPAADADPTVVGCARRRGVPLVGGRRWRLGPARGQCQWPDRRWGPLCAGLSHPLGSLSVLSAHAPWGVLRDQILGRRDRPLAASPDLWRPRF